MKHLLLVFVVLLTSIANARDELRLRRGEPAPVGEVLSINAQGVVVGSPAVAPVLVPWGRVLEVGGHWAEPAQTYAEIADLAWRAELRLARGDVLTAEPMFERLIELIGERADESDGPTKAAALSGLLRCQLGRGARALAVSTWTQWVDALGVRSSVTVYRRRGGGSVGGPSGGPSGGTSGGPRGSAGSVQPEDGSILLPRLPPMWSNDEDAQFLANQQEPEGDTASKGATLGMLYWLSARVAVGLPDTMPEGIAGDAEVLFIADLVRAQMPERELSRPARLRLEQRLEAGMPGWQEAWTRIAIGRSLVAEDNQDLREQGVVQLLHVPSRLMVVSPGLTGLALQDAARALEAMGEDRASAVLRNELRRMEDQMMMLEESLP